MRTTCWLKTWRLKSQFLNSLLMALLILASGVSAQAATINVPISGEIERLTLNEPANIYSGGILVVGGQNVILPKNLLIDLPANRLTLQQIFAQAPAGCVAGQQSGLAKADSCNTSGTGGFATISAVRTNAGNIIAGDVFIEKGRETVTGQVTYINHTDGYFRVNGAPGSSTTGVMLRLNDPTSRHTVQQGSGCAGGPNCSPDPRFTLDPDNYVIAFSTGYPVCIPSTVQRTFVDILDVNGNNNTTETLNAQSDANGLGDLLCPSANRTAAVVEPPVADSRRFAPLQVGDSITAEGNFETIGGVRFVSVHTMRVNKALQTRNDPTQPDYFFLEEVFMEAPGFQNQRARAMWIGFTSLSDVNGVGLPSDVDIWSIHRDPVTNEAHEFPLASVQGCDAAAGAGTCSGQGLIGAGGNIFRIRYDVDFLLAALADPKYPGGAAAKLNPCLHLQASTRFTASNPNICPGGATLANNFGIMSPIPHEIIGRTGHSLDNPGLVTIDVRGNEATNGQYLFPLGMNLGGIEVAEMTEIDINLLATPVIFEGIPWNHDRRLGPGGCLNAGGCEANPQPLDPFPYTGLDPRTQADFAVVGVQGGTPNGPYSDLNFTNTTLTNARNRVLSYVRGTPFIGGNYNFDGNNTLLSLAALVDPPLLPITPTLPLTISCMAGVIGPLAVNDTASTNKDVAKAIAVLANDLQVFAPIDPAMVSVTTPPVSGATLVNTTTGVVTYTPNPGFTGTDTFVYRVADFNGILSNFATVTVTVSAVNTAPVASNDAGAIINGTVPNVAINVVANDTDTDGTIAVNSVEITVLPLHGTANPTVTGSVTYTPDAGYVGADTFSYRVKDNAGAFSNVAVVTIDVTAPPAETIAVTRAQFTLNGAQWRVDGTTTARIPGETMMIFNTATVPADIVATPPMGTVAVGPTGLWTWTSDFGAPLPNGTRRISIRSSLTGTLNNVLIVIR